VFLFFKRTTTCKLPTFRRNSNNQEQSENRATNSEIINTEVLHPLDHIALVSVTFMS
jgi:hypothetical protein